MEILQVDELKQFIEIVETRFDARYDHLFRGQSRDLRLVPSIARTVTKYNHLLVAEQDMLDEFKRGSALHLRVHPTCLWDWLALGQHYGLPTRLLDWSQNPLAALWFAVRWPPTSPRDVGVVWALSPTEEDYASEARKNTFPSDRPWIFAPTHVSERMPAQGAWCTVHASRRGASGPDPRQIFDPLEESERFRNKLLKIAIPAVKFAHFRFHLARCGAHAASALPGLDGLCEHIRWRAFNYDDERDPGEKTNLFE